MKRCADIFLRFNIFRSINMSDKKETNLKDLFLMYNLFITIHIGE